MGRIRVIGPNDEVLQNRYCHHLGCTPAFAKLWYGMVAAAGALESARTFVVTYGVIWIRRLAQLLFPHAQLILDWYHAKGYICEVGSLCWDSVPVGVKPLPEYPFFYTHPTSASKQDYVVGVAKRDFDAKNMHLAVHAGPSGRARWQRQFER